MPGPDGTKKIHVEMNLHGARLSFADRSLMGVGSDPDPDKVQIALHLNVPDAVAAAQRAIDAGCTERSKVEEQFWGDIYGQLVDPYGFLWALLTPGKPKSEAEIHEAMKAMAQ